MFRSWRSRGTDTVCLPNIITSVINASSLIPSICIIRVVYPPPFFRRSSDRGIEENSGSRRLLSPCFHPFDIQESLDLPHGHHFLAQVVFVCPDRAVPSSNRLILAYHDVLRNFVQQSEGESVVCEMTNVWRFIPKIMRNDHNSSAKSVNSVCQRVDGWDIQSVGRFIK